MVKMQCGKSGQNSIAESQVLMKTELLQCVLEKGTFHLSINQMGWNTEHALTFGYNCLCNICCTQKVKYWKT